MPNSSEHRGRLGYLKLICAVLPAADSGFAFAGAFFRPGALLDESELWPNNRYPPVPLLIECAGLPKHEWESKRRAEDVYILWRYEQSEWVEIARSRGRHGSWAADLAPIAARILNSGKLPADLSLVVLRVCKTLDVELDYLDDAERLSLLGKLHDALSARLVLGGWVGVAPTVRSSADPLLSPTRPRRTPS